MEWKNAQRNEAGLLKIPKRWLHTHYYEALNILFRFENSVRVFVYAVLKNELGDKWQECSFSMPGSDSQSIKGIAARRIGHSETFGYLGFDIRAPLMHLTSGELIELVTSDAHWPKFKAYFKGDKGIMKNKLLEIGSIRNSLAHFRPIKSDDIEVVKQNSKHTLVGVEACLRSMFSQRLRVPTNTQDEWYKSISTLGTANIVTTPYYSSDESWVNVKLVFKTLVLKRDQFGESFFEFKLAKFNPASVLARHANLRKHVTYVSESLSTARLDEDSQIEISKSVNFVFRKDVLEAAHGDISVGFASVLREVTDECKLLQEDNLARGQLVEVVQGYSYLHTPEGKEEGTWRHSYDELQQPYEATHPDEYWGQSIYTTDEVAGSRRYPWMPEDISEPEGWGD